MWKSCSLSKVYIHVPLPFSPAKKVFHTAVHSIKVRPVDLHVTAPYHLFLKNKSLSLFELYVIFRTSNRSVFDSSLEPACWSEMQQIPIFKSIVWLTEFDLTTTLILARYICNKTPMMIRSNDVNISIQ